MTSEDCQRATLKAYAEAHARTVAEIFVSASVKVSCWGKGYACGYVIVEGSALAGNVAKAMAGAFLSAEPSGKLSGGPESMF